MSQIAENSQVIDSSPYRQAGWAEIATYARERGIAFDGNVNPVNKRRKSEGRKPFLLMAGPMPEGAALMSIEQTLLTLKFNAAKPEIAEIEKDIAFAIEGRPTAEAAVALVRTIASIVLEARPESQAEMLRRITNAIATHVAMGRTP